MASGLVQVRDDGTAFLARIEETDTLGADAPRHQYWGCDTSKARTVLRFQTARSAAESAAETIRSYVAAGLLAPFCEIGKGPHGDKCGPH
jgi:hypothetical protein